MLGEIADAEVELLAIGTVARETGLSNDTLRVWERRYGFPRPLRDDAGTRLYPRAQVDRLRRIKQLLDKGFRPGKIIKAGNDVVRR